MTKISDEQRSLHDEMMVLYRNRQRQFSQHPLRDVIEINLAVTEGLEALPETAHAYFSAPIPNLDPEFWVMDLCAFEEREEYIRRASNDPYVQTLAQEVQADDLKSGDHLRLWHGIKRHGFIPVVKIDQDRGRVAMYAALRLPGTTQEL
jgi:hypothetical protein